MQKEFLKKLTNVCTATCLVLGFNCSTIKNIVKPPENKKIIIEYNPSPKAKFIIKESDSKQYLVILNEKTKQSWKISYHDWKVLNAAYKNWRVVESKKPFISRIEETPSEVIVIFNYYKKIKTKEGTVRNSILSGKLKISKDYIKGMQASYNPYLLGASGAILTYALIVTIILII